MDKIFSDRTKHIFSLANDLALKKNQYLSAFHVLYIIIDSPEKYINDILKRTSVNIEVLKTNVYDCLFKLPKIQNVNQVDETIITLFRIAENLMIKNKLMGAKMGHFKDFSLFYRPWLGSLACLGSGGTRVRSS